MSGTCADCEHSKEPPCANCEHCFVNGGEVYGSKFKRKCPLPRVGSKDWGWSHGERKYSDKTDYYVRDHSIFSVNGGFVASAPSVSTAKRIAELLTRLDWKRENGRKDVSGT